MDWLFLEKRSTAFGNLHDRLHLSQKGSSEIVTQNQRVRHLIKVPNKVCVPSANQAWQQEIHWKNNYPDHWRFELHADRLKEFLFFKCPPTSRHTLTSPRNPWQVQIKLQSRSRSTTCRGQKRISSDRSPTSLSLGREISQGEMLWPCDRDQPHLTHGNTWEQHWKNAATYQMNVPKIVVDPLPLENAWSWLRSTTQPKKTNSTWQKTAIGPNDLFFVDDLCPVISVKIYHSIS